MLLPVLGDVIFDIGLREARKALHYLVKLSTKKSAGRPRQARGLQVAATEHAKNARLPCSTVCSRLLSMVHLKLEAVLQHHRLLYHWWALHDNTDLPRGAYHFIIMILNLDQALLLLDALHSVDLGDLAVEGCGGLGRCGFLD